MLKNKVLQVGSNLSRHLFLHLLFKVLTLVFPHHIQSFFEVNHIQIPPKISKHGALTLHKKWATKTRYLTCTLAEHYPGAGRGHAQLIRPIRFYCRLVGFLLSPPHPPPGPGSAAIYGHLSRFGNGRPCSKCTMPSSLSSPLPSLMKETPRVILL